MLFVSLEIAGGKMVVMLLIAHSRSVDGNSAREWACHPGTQLGGQGLIAPAGLHIIPAGLPLRHRDWVRAASSPQIGSPGCPRVVTKAEGILPSGLCCQP